MSPKVNSEEAAQASPPSPCNRLGLPGMLGVPKNSQSWGGTNIPAPTFLQGIGPQQRSPKQELSLVFVGKTLFIAPDLKCLFEKTVLGAIFRARLSSAGCVVTRNGRAE